MDHQMIQEVLSRSKEWGMPPSMAASTLAGEVETVAVILEEMAQGFLEQAKACRELQEKYLEIRDIAKSLIGR